MGASESSLVWLLHSTDSADERGECWSACDDDVVVGLMESCGMSRRSGSDGIGSFGWEVEVVGMPRDVEVDVEEAIVRVEGRRNGTRKEDLGARFKAGGGTHR
jgi:hypothetical protein